LVAGGQGLAFYAFDLIWHDDRDLRRQSLACLRQKICTLMEAVMKTWPDPEDEHEEEPEPKHEEEEEPLRCMSTSRTGVKQFENFNPP
jgi:hypothetical protein